MNIPVAIVEDNNDIRQALENIIEMADGYEVACTCVNGEDAIIKLPIFLPEVVLMDINLGGINGIEVVRELKIQHPEMLFMMCTIYEEDEKIL
jgi:DNA-binding NarL/FixJ family response regulator